MLSVYYALLASMYHNHTYNDIILTCNIHIHLGHIQYGDNRCKLRIYTSVTTTIKDIDAFMQSVLHN